MKYLIFIFIEIQRKLTSKFDFLIELFSIAIRCMISVFLWMAIFAKTERIANYTNSMMLNYLITASILSMVYTFEPCFTLGNLVRTGRLSIRLVRPIDLWKSGLAEQIGRKIIYIIFLFGICLLRYHLEFKIITLGIIIANFLMFYSFMSLISIVGFYLENTWPLRPVFSGIYLLLGGLLFPLDILPSTIYNIIKYNPFSLVSHITTKILMQDLLKNEALIFIGISILYTLFFRFLYILLFKKGLKTYEGVGV